MRDKTCRRRKTRLVKEAERFRSACFFFYNPTLVCALAFVNWVRPVTLAAGMLYVLVPIQLFVSATETSAGSEERGTHINSSC